MKRSEINALIAQAIDLLHANQIRLPPFGYWTPADWQAKGSECDEIRACKLGWDITDFGTGEFAKVGLVVFTVRNGHRQNAKYAGKTYCEKLLITREEQRTPMHYHAFKAEDIISRSGGHLLCQLYPKGDDGKLAKTPVQVSLDGVSHTFPAGHIVKLKPGESITLTPGLYHEFWAERGTGTAILGEVSKVNDDATDNFFLTAPKRFPTIEEDEPVRYPLCTEV
jgi:D-lyxose ketol-isomerase